MLISELCGSRAIAHKENCPPPNPKTNPNPIPNPKSNRGGNFPHNFEFRIVF